MENVSYRVLLVEDNEDDFIIVRDLLGDIRTTKYDLQWVSTYESAQEALTHHHYDVCLVDDHVGEGMGVELVREFGRDQTPFILLTGHEDYAEDVAATKAGASDYLLKGQINGALLERSIRYAIEHMRVQERLRRSAANLAKAQEIAHIGSWELDLSNLDDLNSNALYWSDEAFRIFGYEPHESDASNENFFRAVHPDDRELVGAAVAQSLREYKPYSIEHRVVLPDGRERVVHEQSDIVFDERTGKPLRMVGTVQDITQRKQAEEALHDSEERYRSLFESNPHPMWVYDRNSFGFLAVNDAAINHYGYSRHEFLSMTLMDVRPPEEIPGFLVNVSKPAPSDGKRGIHRHWKKDGTVIEADITTHELSFEGRPARLALANDVTARRVAEKQISFQAHLLNEVGQAVIATDAEGTVVFWNRHAETLYGWTTQEATGKNTHALTVAEMAVGQVEEIMAQLNRGQTWSGEFMVQRRDGTAFPAAVTNTPIYDETGTLSAIIGISQDITERRKAEDALRLSEEHLRFIVDASNDGIWEWDVASGKVTWSERIYTLLGLSPESFEPSYESQFALIHPDDVATFERAIQEHLETDVPYHLRVRYRHSNGSYLHVLAQGQTQRDEEGRAQRMLGSFSDLTRLIQAETEREARSREIVTIWESMTDAFFSLDTQWRFTRINSRGTQLLQKSSEELIGSVVWEMFPEARGSTFEREYHRAVAEQVKVDFEEFYPALNSWFEVHAYPSPSGLSVYFHDISERKQAEDALRRSEALFRTLVNSSWDAFHLISPDGRIIYESPAVTRLLGYDPEEMIGQHAIEFVHPDDSRQLMEEATTLLNSPGSMRTVTLRVRHKDGSWRWVESFEVNLVDHPDVGALAVNYHDITERKLAEEERDRFFTISLDLLCVADHNGYFKRLNPAFETTLGHSNAELMAKPFLEWVHPDDREATLAAMKDLDAGSPTLKFANRYLCRDGSYRWLSWVAVPFEDVIYAVAHDITTLKDAEIALHRANDELELHVMERTVQLKVSNELLRVENVEHQMTMETLRQFAQALQEAKEEAERANAAKSEFLSRMSHELRTPLNAILGFGQIMEMRSHGADLQQKENIGQILKGGRHLLSLINEVLDITRVEAGAVELSLEPIALEEIVPEVADLVAPLAAQRGVRLDYNLSKAGENYVLADWQRLKQVLLNMLSNAIKYNRVGGQVEVSCEAGLKGVIAIRVRDTGIGIAPQDLPKLFVPFERLGAANSSIEGTGLGLVLSKRLVAAMQGTLEVESTLGEGTTFTLTLPQATSPERQVLDIAEDKIGMHLNTGLQEESTFSVLCIEDNPSNLRLIETVLQSRPQVKLLPAVQGSIGLELAQQHLPDLILLDLHLPDMFGAEVLAHLRQSHITRDIPVIVISADATERQIQRLLEAGAMAYLTKPLDVAHFLRLLDEVLLRQLG